MFYNLRRTLEPELYSLVFGLDILIVGIVSCRNNFHRWLVRLISQSEIEVSSQGAAPIPFYSI